MSKLSFLLALQQLDLALQGEHNQSRVRDLMQERASLLARIDDAPLLAYYNKLRRSGLGKALAQVEGNACGCCLAIITPSELAQLRANTRPQTCSNCGRILYLH